LDIIGCDDPEFTALPPVDTNHQCTNILSEAVNNTFDELHIVTVLDEVSPRVHRWEKLRPQNVYELRSLFS
jgi:hypothetical protein